MIEMEEVWRPIKGYEGIYEISSFWRVRSLDRYDRRGTFHKGRPLKVKKSRLPELYDGLYVKLCKNGVYQERDIRYIMVRTFEDCENFQEILASMPG